jgi:hypothetical protein
MLPEHQQQHRSMHSMDIHASNTPPHEQQFKSILKKTATSSAPSTRDVARHPTSKSNLSAKPLSTDAESLNPDHHHHQDWQGNQHDTQGNNLKNFKQGPPGHSSGTGKELKGLSHSRRNVKAIQVAKKVKMVIPQRDVGLRYTLSSNMHDNGCIAFQSCSRLSIMIFV